MKRKRSDGFIRRSLDVSWCRRGDSNPHGFPHHPLKMACLPVPPLRRAARKNHIIHLGLENQGGDSAARFPFQTVPNIVIYNVKKPVNSPLRSHL
jgi:hypothetical protein